MFLTNLWAAYHADTFVLDKVKLPCIDLKRNQIPISWLFLAEKL